MDSYSFYCYGHINISASHKTTLEITRDENLTGRGDCIIGVKADYSLRELKEFLNGADRARMVIECSGLIDEIEFSVNSHFDGADEIVIRLGEYMSGRTLGVHASKSSMMIDRRIIKKMQDERCRAKVSLVKL